MKNKTDKITSATEVKRSKAEVQLKYDIYYDNELTPPSWTVRKFYRDIDNTIVVIDAILTSNKKSAKKLLSKKKKENKSIPDKIEIFSINDLW